MRNKKMRAVVQRRAWFMVSATVLLSVPIIGYALVLGDYENTATVTAGASQYETITTNNTSTVQITPNAELVIVANISNDDGGDAVVGDFTITTNAGSLSFTAGTTVAGVTPFTSSTLYVPPGTYSLVESDVAGYTEGSWSCSVGTVNDTTYNSGEVELTFGQQTVCTITNDDIAPELTLVKNVTNNFGPARPASDFDPSIDGTEVLSGTAYPLTANNDYTISEAPIGGYTAGTWSCSDANSLTTSLPTAGTATGATVNMEVGSDVTCTITNTAVQPLLTLVKIVENFNGGTLDIDDFDISIDGTEVPDGIAQPVASGTDIVISELDLPSYNEGTWSCTDDNSLTTGLPTAGLATSTTVNLEPGSDVTCTITNDDIGIDLAIAKSVDDSTPNIGDTITFTLEVTNAGPDAATTVTVTDVIPDGFSYFAGSIAGGDTNDDSDPAGSGLVWTLNSVPVSASPTILTFQAIVQAP
ncbi:MAG: DUF11 domain-containing protein [Gammaproteobacteria bacterium]|nr:DUF11 domain-containing protein [Gammaproteobacteria bacterium]